MLVWQMQPQMLQGIFDDSRTSAGRNFANLLFPITIVGLSSTKKLWAFDRVIVRTHFCSFLLPLSSLTMTTSCFPDIYREMFYFNKSFVWPLCHMHFLFCVHYSERFCQGTHNTFLLRRALWQSFVTWFIAFPKLVRLILGGEMLVGVPCKIFLPSCQRRVASRCFDETCFGSDGSCMIVLGVALLLCTLPGYFSFAALSILAAFACSISLSLLVRSRCLCLFDFAIT